MTNLAAAIADCLAAHAECLEKLGTDRPETSERVPAELRGKLQRQWAKVSATLEGTDPAVHAVHVAALTKGVRLAVKRYGRC